ncbi:MAG: histidine kinase dimerization/phospho-acceptor domain-containing protein, partial [Flavobacteriales bacterium]
MMLRGLKLGTKLRLANIILLLFSFILIGVTTYLNINKQNNTYHKKRFERKEQALLKEVEYHLLSKAEYVTEENFIENFVRFTRIRSDINKLDINFYNLDGELLINSNPERFKHFELPLILSQSITTKVLLSKRQLIEEIDTPNGKYFSSFFLIKNKRNENLAILNIPYFDFNEVKRSDIQWFLEDLLIIYLFLFILAFFLSYFLSKLITEPLRSLSERINKLGIDGQNKELNWQVDDEIGVLINEYNKTSIKLKESAELLAQKERESAWREMAKQVAHEIKNPLTPMRLSVQHLLRSYDANDPKSEDKLKRVANSIIEQIDALTNIANEFSNFAKMPRPSEEKLDIIALVRSAKQVFVTGEITVQVVTELEDALIRADRNQMIRVFNNLIKNAIQATPEDR